MITPPLNAASFFSLYMTAKSAQGLVGLMTSCEDIEIALVTSRDFTSDIEATVKCIEASKAVAELIGQNVEPVISHNPIYLPNHKNLFDEVEFNSDGEIDKVSGFNNPFVAVTVKLSAEDQPNFVDASVCYKQFELPPIREFVESDSKVLLS